MTINPIWMRSGWEPHAGSFRTVTLKNGTHPDLVNPERIPEIIAEAF